MVKQVNNIVQAHYYIVELEVVVRPLSKSHGQSMNHRTFRPRRPSSWRLRWSLTAEEGLRGRNVLLFTDLYILHDLLKNFGTVSRHVTVWLYLSK